MKRIFFQAAVVSILLYGCTTWTSALARLFRDQLLYLFIYSILIFYEPFNHVTQHLASPSKSMILPIFLFAYLTLSYDLRSFFRCVNTAVWMHYLDAK